MTPGTLTGSSAARATEHALQVPELREAVLLRLPINDLLLRAPLVCKSWKQTIDFSPRLQWALFMSPLPGKPVFTVCMTGKGSGAAWLQYNGPTPRQNFTVLVNPFCAKIREDINHGDDMTKDVLARPGSSWRRMLVCQVPTVDCRRAAADEKEPVRMPDVVDFGNSTSMPHWMWGLKGKAAITSNASGEEVLKMRAI